MRKQELLRPMAEKNEQGGVTLGQNCPRVHTRKAGEILAGMVKAKGGRGKTNDPTALVSLGITGKQSSRWQAQSIG